MAHAAGVTTFIQSKLFFSTTYVAPAPANHAALSTLLGEANEVNDVTDLGNLGDEANILRYIVLGASTEKTVAGVAGLPEWTFTVALNEADAIHSAIRDAANGTICSLGLQTVVGAGETVDYVLGQIASKPKILDSGAPTSMEVTIAMSQAPLRFGKA